MTDTDVYYKCVIHHRGTVNVLYNCSCFVYIELHAFANRYVSLEKSVIFLNICETPMLPVVVQYTYVLYHMLCAMHALYSIKFTYSMLYYTHISYAVLYFLYYKLTLYIPLSACINSFTRHDYYKSRYTHRYITMCLTPYCFDQVRSRSHTSTNSSPSSISTPILYSRAS